MKVVVALGGNAIVGRERRANIEEQFKATKKSMKGIVKMIKEGWDLAIVHGNGPQVGALLLQQKISRNVVPPLPLHVCVSLTQGQIGYIIQNCLINEMRREGINKSVASVVTQVIVDKNDDAFKNPTKPIGPIYNEREAKEMEKYYNMGKYENGYRILAPSPRPLAIVELDAIKKLMENGVIVVAGGGGGIPVVMENGTMVGIDAVIDKDLAAEKMASQINADILLILTDVEYVYLDYATPNQKKIENIKVDEIMEYYNQGQFPPGSMGPKVEAAIKFVKNGGKKTIITSIEKAWEAINGKTGTHIVP